MTPPPAAPGLLLSRRPAPQRLLAVAALFDVIPIVKFIPKQRSIMKKVMIIALILVGAVFVPAASAYEETFTDSKIISNDYTYTGGEYAGTLTDGNYRLRFSNIECWPDLKVVYVRTGRFSFSNLTLAKSQDSIQHYVDFIVSGTNQNIGHGYLAYNIFYDGNGNPDVVQFWVEFEEWDITSLAGYKEIRLQLNPDSPLKQFDFVYFRAGDPDTNRPIVFGAQPGTGGGAWNWEGYYIVNSQYDWTNRITITDDRLILLRDRNYSKLTIQTGENTYQEESYDDRSIYINPPINWTVTNLYGTSFTGKYPTDTPEDPSEDSGLTVYIKNSQTGALIANANVAIDGLVNGEYYPVVNRTEPSGIFSITLQQTGGGQPNPDGYRLIVTADGYYNPTPAINFTVDAYTKLSTYLYLDPIAGGPADENKTFIDFFVRDMSSNPISGATVKFGKYTLITNSAGYTVFEVEKNNNYSWIVSKSGYGPLTGNAVIGDAPRHTINTVLAPVVTPTQTTPIPTSPPIGPTPTMTAPSGEPVSNWLEWFAAHFGMILGGGVEIGKIFMWLCFTVPVGVYVGKESKAGAAGFMAGAGIVTLFFVLIGWVPIWLVVLLALIIGLLYAKEFNSPDNGGGR